MCTHVIETGGTYYQNSVYIGLKQHTSMMETAYSWLGRNVPGLRKGIVEKKVSRKKISYWSEEEEPTIRGTR